LDDCEVVFNILRNDPSVGRIPAGLKPVPISQIEVLLPIQNAVHIPPREEYIYIPGIFYHMIIRNNEVLSLVNQDTTALTYPSIAEIGHYPDHRMDCGIVDVLRGTVWKPWGSSNRM